MCWGIQLAIVLGFILLEKYGQEWFFRSWRDEAPVTPLSDPPPMYGWLEPFLVRTLYWLSLQKLDQPFRKNKPKHGQYIDVYVLFWTTAAFAVAGLGWGHSLWVLAVWRALELAVQALSVGPFRDKIRQLRGDEPSPSSERIVVFSLLNWAELVALFAIIYHALRGGDTWLYASLSTQITMGHTVEPTTGWEKLAIGSQVSLSLLIITVLVGRYVSMVGQVSFAKKEGKENDATTH